MNNINMSGIKINNTENANAVNAPANDLEIKEKIEDTSKDASEPTVERGQKQDKHVVTYIGNSEYTDATGHKWHKHEEMTYIDSEYSKRADLHFMVKYGEMKHTVVSM